MSIFSSPTADAEAKLRSNQQRAVKLLLALGSRRDRWAADRRRLIDDFCKAAERSLDLLSRVEKMPDGLDRSELLSRLADEMGRAETLWKLIDKVRVFRQSA